MGMYPDLSGAEINRRRIIMGDKVFGPVATRRNKNHGFINKISQAETNLCKPLANLNLSLHLQ